MIIFMAGFMAGILFLAFVELFLTGIGRSELEQELIIEREINRILRELNGKPNSKEEKPQLG